MVHINKTVLGHGSNNDSHTDKKIGSVVEAVVTNIMDYGVFVEWGRRKSGLVYWMELSDSRAECKRLMATLKQGDKLTAMIIESHLEGKRSLSVKALILKRKEEERKRKEEFISRCTPGQILDASVVELRKKDIVVKIGKEGIEECILRKDLPREMMGELFEGMPLQLEYKGSEDGRLMLGMKRGYDYEEGLFVAGVEELLETMGIRGTRKFIGRANRGTLAEVISVSDDMANDGKLLIDPVTGKCLRVLLPTTQWEYVQDGKYYEVELVVAPEEVRRKAQTPYHFEANPDYPPEEREDPYESLIKTVFGKQTSPSSNTSLANLLGEVGQNLYSGKKRMLYELIQNADDAAPKNGVDVRVRIDGDYFILSHNGYPLNIHDFESITSAAKSTKRTDERKTGYKGIGFKSVFTNSDLVRIKSGGFNFSFDKGAEVFTQFESFYRKVNDIQDDEKWKEFKHKYRKEEAEFRGVRDIPWQLLPLSSEGNIENQSVADNVCIAIRMNSDIIGEYRRAVDEVFQNPRFALFLRRTKCVQVLGTDGTWQRILKHVGQEDDCVSLRLFPSGKKENYRIYTREIEVGDSHFEAAGLNMHSRERCNQSGEKENYFVTGNGEEIEGIPDRIASAKQVTVSYAVLLDAEAHIKLLKEGISSFFCYLPMNEKRFYFPFFINADFIPRSDRESLQDDNPWNHFLFYEMGKLVVEMVRDMASENEPKYLNLLPSEELVADDQGEETLPDAFNRGYREALDSIGFVLDDTENLSRTQDIILDESGFAEIVGHEAFYALMDDSKRLPHRKIDTEVLSNELFEVECLEEDDVAERLLDDVDGVREWISTVQEETRVNFYSWILNQGEYWRERLIKDMPVFDFGTEWLSFSEVEDTDNDVIVTDKISPYRGVLEKLGFSCSSGTFGEKHPLYKEMPGQDERKLFGKIQGQVQSYNGTLTADDRINILKAAKVLSGVGEASLREWPLFRNKMGETRPLKNLFAYDTNCPEWLHEYMIARGDNHPELAGLLVSKGDIFTKIVRGNINAIIKSIDALEVCWYFRDEWTDADTKSLFGNVDVNKDSLLKILEEHSGASAREAFIKGIREFPLYSTNKYNSSSDEYRIVKLATVSTTSSDHLRSVTTIDGLSLEKLKCNDALIISNGGNNLQFSLSQMLPEEYGTSSGLSRIEGMFRDIPNVDRVFSSQSEDAGNIYTKLSRRTGGINAEAYCFMVAYRSTHQIITTYRSTYQRSYYVQQPTNSLPLSSESMVTSVLDRAMELNMGMMLKNYVEKYISGSLGFNGKYIDCDELTLKGERIPEYIKKWASSEEKKAFLSELGVLDGNVSDMLLRRAFLEDKKCDEKADAGKFLDWVEQSGKFELPVKSVNRVSVLEHVGGIQEKRCEEDIKEAEEWNDAAYSEWKKGKATSIYLFNGEINVRGYHNDRHLYNRISKIEKGYLVFKRKNFSLGYTCCIYLDKGKDIEALLSLCYSDPEVGGFFTKEDWYSLFMVTKSAYNKLLEENRELKQAHDDSAEISLRESSHGGLSEEGKKEALIEAKKAVEFELKGQGYEFTQGICEDEYSLVNGVKKDGMEYPLVVRSYKNTGRTFQLSAEDWEQLTKENSMLYLNTSFGVRCIPFYSLLTGNDGEMHISFKCENFKMPERARQLASVLKFFKGLHFEFPPFSPDGTSSKAERFIKPEKSTDEKPSSDEEIPL